MRLIAIDQLTGTRQLFELSRDARLSDELMRLFPEKISGPWTLYARTVHKDRELTPQQMIEQRVKKGDVYILLMRPGTGVELAWYWQVAIAVLLAATSYLLAPKPRRPHSTPSEQAESGTSALAGQSNVLRPGARVPDILGRVRCYPDLMCYPVETWYKRRQELAQLFVIGVGDYEINDDDIRLGETPILSIAAATPLKIPPGTAVPLFPLVRAAPEVSSVSLSTEDETAIPTTNTSFNAAAKTMTLQEMMPIPLNYPITIQGSNFNNGLRWVTAVPAAGSAGPYVYTLEGPVVDETNSNPSIAIGVAATPLDKSVSFAYYNAVFEIQPMINSVQVWPELIAPAVGEIVEIRATSGRTYRGTVTDHFRNTSIGGGFIYTVLLMRDVYGVQIDFRPQSYDEPAVLTRFTEGTAGGGGPPTPSKNVVTNWYTVPMDDPLEIWFDVAFPAGLAWYKNGVRNALTILINVEIKHRGQPETGVPSLTFSYTQSTTGSMRFTERIPVASLAHIADNGQPFEIRFIRQTARFMEDVNNQYMQDTQIVRVAGMRYLESRAYPEVTIELLTMANDNSSVSLRDVAFNLIVERKVPHWTGAGWTAPTKSKKWADNFVARLKAVDGLHLQSDELIDIAGIYALQDQLDQLDGGKQGEIGLALDQLQDIDAELAQIADVVRAQVYRVGRKVHVIRDQETSQRIALFNGRAKSSDAEAVGLRMKASDENDAVIVSWMDEASGWKQREYQYPPEPIVYASNPLRVGTLCANWAQAYRRARYEWARLLYRRETLTCPVTEDGRICRPGDVVNMTDDVANLAAAAGEVLYVSGNVLTLDRDVTFGPAGNTVLVRDVHGQTIDAIPVIAVAGSPNRVQLTRAPIAGVTLKPRDETLGTLFAFYHDSAAIVRPWLLTGVEVAGPYVQLSGVNYTPRVYEGDSVTLPAQPAIGETTP